MTKTVIGLYDSFAEAQTAVQDLMNFGIPREDISLVSRDEQGGMSEQRGTDEGSASAEGAGAGAVGGSIVGGALGLLIGTGLLIIPGIGPVLAAGPLAAAIGSTAAAVGATALGAGLGAAAGGLLGGLIGAGVPEDEAQFYVEGVRRGGTLLSANTPDSDADNVRQILLRNGAVDIDRRADEWRTAGWDNRADADPMTGGAHVGGDASRDWEDSSKVGTATGTAAGAATGAAIGSVGGPIGSVVGGIAGAAAGAATGAAGDVAGERADDDSYRGSERVGSTGIRSSLDEASQQVRTTLNRTGERIDDASDSSRVQLSRAGDRLGDATESLGSGHTRMSDRVTDQDERARGEAGDLSDDWQDSSKAGTATGTAAGAATGAAIGAVGGPVGSVIGGIAGAAAGAVTGAAGDVAGERADDSTKYADGYRSTGLGAGDAGRSPGAYIESDDGVHFNEDSLANGTAGGDASPSSHGDFARGQREAPVEPVGPDYARGQDIPAPTMSGSEDFARGQRELAAEAVEPDYARGQRSFDQYGSDFATHHSSMGSSRGYDYYQPGYRFGYDMANDSSLSGSDWSTVERDARTRWERERPNSWDEFKQSIRYAWEKARGTR